MEIVGVFNNDDKDDAMYCELMCCLTFIKNYERAKQGVTSVA